MRRMLSQETFESCYVPSLSCRMKFFDDLFS